MIDHDFVWCRLSVVCGDCAVAVDVEFVGCVPSSYVDSWAAG